MFTVVCAGGHHSHDPGPPGAPMVPAPRVEGGAGESMVLCMGKWRKERGDTGTVEGTRGRADGLEPPPL